MRRVLLGLLVFGLALWAVLSNGQGEVLADTSNAPNLAAMLQASETGGAPAAQPAEATPNADAEVEGALVQLLGGLARGDSVAKAQAERLLARADLAADHRSRLEAALSASVAVPAPSNENAPTPANAGEVGTAGGPAPSPGVDPKSFDDFGALLQKLGENNSFVHTSEGRALGRRGLELLQKLGDEAALAAGTQLLERCMRGPIERTHKDAIAFVDEAYKAHKVRADRLLCDPASVTRSRTHVVAKGDTMGKIASSFRKEGLVIDETSLAILNRIHNPNAIRPGQRIRCPIDPLHAVVEKKSYLLAVYVGEQILRLYWVGHGADDKTPVTEFVVVEKLKDPDWYSPDGHVYAAGSPENILGRYFLKFDNPSYSGFGAHGTPYPETIGTMSSMGCIRMYDADIDELYHLLPRKAKVAVRDSK